MKQACPQSNIKETIPPFYKWKISYFNKFDYKYSKKFISIKRQEYLLSLVNKNVVWQLDGENITILPMILSLQNIYTKASNIVVTKQF